MHRQKTGTGQWTGFSRTLPLYTLLTSRGPSPAMDDFPPSRLRPSPAEVFSTSTHTASCAAVLLPAAIACVCKADGSNPRPCRPRGPQRVPLALSSPVHQCEGWSPHTRSCVPAVPTPLLA